MAEWRKWRPNGGMAEWWNGRMAEMVDEMADRMEEWRNGGMAEWRKWRPNGGMVEWQEWLPTYYIYGTRRRRQ